ncbi:transposase [Endozoicomonas sp. GU-1]|uniref:IS66 family transposase n=1 Tax=Endozoicomonas sp. GU-1 TaxID=3009078 RepID=UPI0022B496B5|nr:transposase [Endozoicomonas sp. GU-1]WBA80099.1 transposase [Endozoicomonas sp. GU-1]WBA87677.1 transposase [Endozoicomonas sp. GU-1]
MKDLPPAFLTPAFQERIELPPEEKQGALETFFTKVREELDIIPKSAVTVSMLAWIIIAKYCDALPLFRQEKILARYGGSITRTTMANWLIRLSLQLQSLINLMADHQRVGHIMNADETRIQVLKELSKAIHSDKYMWVTLGGPPRQPAGLAITLVKLAFTFYCCHPQTILQLETGNPRRNHAVTFLLSNRRRGIPVNSH